MKTLILYSIYFTLYFTIHFTYLIKPTNAINTNFNSNNYFRLRNAFLRIYITSNKKSILQEYSSKISKKLKQKCNSYYQYTLNKYNDFQIFYNNLSDEEREFIDFIISLCY